MIKVISKLKDVKPLNKADQKKINGGMCVVAFIGIQVF